MERFEFDPAAHNPTKTLRSVDRAPPPPGHLTVANGLPSPWGRAKPGGSRQPPWASVRAGDISLSDLKCCIATLERRRIVCGQRGTRRCPPRLAGRVGQLDWRTSPRGCRRSCAKASSTGGGAFMRCGGHRPSFAPGRQDERAWLAHEKCINRILGRVS
jgi:hypothetical protein